MKITRLFGVASASGLNTNPVATSSPVATSNRPVNQRLTGAQSIRDSVSGSTARASTIPNQNPPMVARRSSPVDCHCWHGYRQSFINAIIKAVPEAINTPSTTTTCRLRCHHERDDDTSRFVDRQMVLISATTRRKASKIVHNALMMIAIGAPISSVAMTINILRMSVAFQVLTPLRSALLRPRARC